MRLFSATLALALTVMGTALARPDAANSAPAPKECYGPAPAVCFYANVGLTGETRIIVAYLFNDDGSPRYAVADATIRVDAVLEDGTRYRMSRPIFSAQPPQPPPNQHMEIRVAVVPADQTTAIVKCSAWVLPPSVPGQVAP
jgi:hypothetical protein